MEEKKWKKESWGTIYKLVEYFKILTFLVDWLSSSQYFYFQIISYHSNIKSTNFISYNETNMKIRGKKRLAYWFLKIMCGYNLNVFLIKS